MIFMIFSFFGYYVYKEETNSIFTLNLEPINGLVTFVLFCVCINALISYPIQILAAFDIAEQHPFFKIGTNRMKKLKSVVMRSLVILTVTGVALLIPDFTVFLDISGSLGAGIIGFILPPLLYNAQFKDTITPVRKWGNYGIFTFGVIGIIISLVNSILNIAKGE